MSKNADLYDAVRKGSLEAVEKYLSEPGLNVNKMYEQGQETLLSAAVRKGSVALVDLLLEKGANVDTATPSKTPLHMACYEGDLRVAKCLIQHQANIEAVDDTNRTAVQWALRGGNDGLFKYLVKNNASTDRVASDGNTMLHDAMMKCSSEFVVELIDTELCEVDVANNAGETALFLAASSGKVDVMKKLILMGADLAVVSKNSETLLHTAAKHGHLNVIQFLIEEMNVQDNYINQQTTEDSFAIIKKIKVATELWTALHFACAYGHTDVVRYLLSNGSDRTMRTRDGLRPVEICKAYRQKHLVPIFEERRASHMPEEDAPTKQQLQNRRKTMPANKPDWIHF